MKTATRRRALTVEMTSGSLWKNILLFSLPLMMTQVLEVLFNLSDVPSPASMRTTPMWPWALWAPPPRWSRCSRDC